MPSHQARRESLPANYQFGDARRRTVPDLAIEKCSVFVTPTVFRLLLERLYAPSELMFSTYWAQRGYRAVPLRNMIIVQGAA